MDSRALRAACHKLAPNCWLCVPSYDPVRERKVAPGFDQSGAIWRRAEHCRSGYDRYVDSQTTHTLRVRPVLPAGGTFSARHSNYRLLRFGTAVQGLWHGADARRRVRLGLRSRGLCGVSFQGGGDQVFKTKKSTAHDPVPLRERAEHRASRLPSKQETHRRRRAGLEAIAAGPPQDAQSRP